MRFSKSIVMLGLLLVFSFSCSRSKGSDKASSGPIQEAQAKEVPQHGTKTAAPKELPPDVLKLNAIQDEIAKLSDEDIIKEETKFNASLRANNLIDRLNANEVDANERAYAKDLLIRLALLRIEKGKRSAKAKN